MWHHGIGLQFGSARCKSHRDVPQRDRGRCSIGGPSGSYRSRRPGQRARGVGTAHGSPPGCRGQCPQRRTQPAQRATAQTHVPCRWMALDGQGRNVADQHNASGGVHHGTLVRDLSRRRKSSTSSRANSSPFSVRLWVPFQKRARPQVC